MARADHNGMIDGYMAVQSVRRNSDRQQDRPRPSTVAPDQELPDTTSTSVPEKSLPFGHTAMPTRHNIHCYACGYQFVHSGRLDRVLCPKCREQLHTGDKTICGSYSGTVQTVGTVIIHSGASVTDSCITASVIRIAGECLKTKLNPGIRVELETGAAVDNAKLERVDVLIASGQQISLETELQCKSLTLNGHLRAQVHAREHVALGEASRFQGRIQSPSITIVDGAALRAELEIKPHQNDTQRSHKNSHLVGG